MPLSRHGQGQITDKENRSQNEFGRPIIRANHGFDEIQGIQVVQNQVARDSAKKSGKPSDKTSSIKGSPRKNSGAAKIEPPEVAAPGEIMSPEEAEQARKRYLLERFWISGRGFWGKRGDRIAWIASVGLLLLIIFNVAVQFGINVWNREIFDAIEKRNSATVLWLSAVFFPLAFTSVGLGVAEVFARMGIQRRWRAWLTEMWCRAG